MISVMQGTVVGIISSSAEEVFLELRAVKLQGCEKGETTIQ
jgi:hypothetical protein